jgi:uncharacterized protein
MTYLPRVVDEELQRRLATMGAVLIEGPKACGKTKTALQEATSQIRLDVDERARQTAAVDPSLLLDGPTPRLIDEWQIAPQIWNHVRRADGSPHRGRVPWLARAPDDRGRPTRMGSSPSFQITGP